MSDSIFDKEYFDSGKHEAGSGRFSEYAISSLLPYFDSLASRLVAELNPTRVLDLGCAKGFLVLAFRRLGIESYGVDISSYALSNAPADVRSCLFRRDLEHETLPFNENSFDLVIASGVLEYVNDYNAVISEARRTMKDGGAFLMIADFTSVSKYEYSKFRVSVYNKAYWIRVFKEHGFELIKDYSKTLTATYVSELFAKAVEGGRVLKYLPRKIALWIFMEHAGRKRAWLLFRLGQPVKQG